VEDASLPEKSPAGVDFANAHVEHM
jgi:hypothetical protein